MAHMIAPVILSGGAGTRLWPMSRSLRPKQLLPLVGEHSMLQQTIQRVSGESFRAPVIICNGEHRFLIAEQLRDLGLDNATIMLEPEGRNTAPAAIVAALHLAEQDANACMLLLPSDHVIHDVAGFHDKIGKAMAAAADGALVTFGIPPTAPETGYGYIEQGDPYDGLPECFRIARFVEKPDRATAESYLADGRHLWNSGMFLLPVASFIAEAERYVPDMVALCRRSIAEAADDLDFVRLAKDPFLDIKGDSIDYAIMERTDKGAMVPADIAWSDVGSWKALWDISERNTSGNVELGDAVTLNTRNCYVRSDGNLIAAIGVEDLIIVATDDVVLVVGKDSAQDVKKIVEEVERSGRTEHYVHTQVFRPWGWYRSIHDGYRFQCKEIMVAPGERLSQQMHHHRAEHWVVVSGTAKVTRGNESFYLTEDESTYIPHNTRHCLENPGKIPLRMIEVQSGPYLGEDDIVRFEDAYGRLEATPLT